MGVIKPGIYTGISNESYHAGAGVSKSGLDDIDKSPEIFHALHMHPDRPQRKARAGQLEGNLAHCSILEPDQFSRRYAMTPADAPRKPSIRQREAKKPSIETLDAIAWWDAWAEETAGSEIITTGQYDVAMRQAEKVREDPDVLEVLSRGAAETSAYWIDDETGELCRCRPDWAHPVGDSSVIILDVKTYSCASPDEFCRQAARKRYHVQDAFYSEGYSIAADVDVLEFIFLAVETDWPYASSLTRLDHPSKDLGRREYRRNLNTYHDCRTTGIWPGYVDGIKTISLPRWVFINEEEST